MGRRFRVQLALAMTAVASGAGLLVRFTPGSPLAAVLPAGAAKATAIKNGWIARDCRSVTEQLLST